MKESKTGIKRINFDMDDQLYERLHSLAKKRKATVTDRLREYTRLGVTAEELALSGNGEIVIRDKNGRERVLLF
jgi:hypothetical protein